MKTNSKVSLLKPSSLKELSIVYGVCQRTFKKWLAPFEKKIGKRVGRYYSVIQVKIIFDCLGIPGDYENFEI